MWLENTFNDINWLERTVEQSLKDRLTQRGRTV